MTPLDQAVTGTAIGRHEITGGKPLSQQKLQTGFSNSQNLHFTLLRANLK